MPIRYKIIPDRKVTYIKAWGKIKIDEIIMAGARMFADTKWENGFNILFDYREITECDAGYKDVLKLVHQDKKHEMLFDKCKCAIVAKSDLVFGLTRMWDTLSDGSNLKKKIFREIHDAERWLGLDLGFSDSMNKFSSSIQPFLKIFFHPFKNRQGCS